METPLLLLLLSAFLLSISNICLGKDIDLISRTQFLKDGDTIISKGGKFEMGFFSPTNSPNRYVGIWYKQIPVQTVVWVANRDAPLAKTSSSTVLKITKLGGQLALVGDKGQAVWSVKTSRSVQNPVAELLDSGNLVVRDAEDEKPENFIWQSFDHPTDHWLPGMKFGWNIETGHEVFFTAWKGENDPASGQYTMHLDPTGYPQLIINNGTTEVLSLGPWNGLRFSATSVDPSSSRGIPRINGPHGVVINKKEVYAWYNLSNDLGLFRFVVTSNGILKLWVWEDEMKQWVSNRGQPSDTCGTYGLCGGNGVCNIYEFRICVCLDTFLPNNNAIATESMSQGCHRRKPLSCHNNGSSSDGFLKYSDIKLPDSKHSWYNESMSLQECEQVCLRNCSCMAYSTLNITNGGSGCLIWYDDLVDMRTVYNGQDLYIRLASSEIPGLKPEPHHSSLLGRKIKILVLCLSMLVVIVLAGVSLFLYICKSKRKDQKLKEEFELPVFDWSTVSRATNNFSEMNKLGQGGFGAVYKGVMDGREEIAVKRLSKNSKQGLEEFKNEVICIAKLQHRNLVKLLGCCISGEEKILIYEYMPNKSLNFFIFDQTKKKLLDWPKRFNIINGVARGLLYLHQDSRLRIIHRDLKASNVLLDTDLNPKISDFGLARSIVENSTGDNTNRVAGTHGYISPEYATHGIFSVKSDVFSFGVLILEIVCGKRNSKFSNEDQYETLPGHVWKFFREGESLTLVDEHISDSYDVAQVLRSIHVGLLCVQQSPEDRPNMSSVVQMLVNDVVLSQPKEPGFFVSRRVAVNSESSSGKHATSSLNEVTMSSLDPR
ncbi:PREDICTED: G-type lectin S-receptor-like serine/threonine-protein kinase At4g27290 isoform X2 [Ipomoea nil]|uniref:G-type lectin S-receptor-like serine/threonine-protein kinase At4g27290 isoform X2 n=1 Tax=Ipomoea nil TaxID=35883 RepID=UPI000901D90F|nr:PREDICTED: G-type lectin S-receptor-like serine/threonine-protein kinase At4g27290 isoform X2 [Ipomoea nil]